MFDFLVVGCGWYGATFARMMTDAGKKCLIIDQRDHIGGNAYTENIDGINVHRYGIHVFHTNNKPIWDFVNRYAEFNNFILSPKANFHGGFYSLPFNMNTFREMWGVTTPESAQAIINKQKLKLYHEPRNLEEQALSLVGEDIYNVLIKDYTTKQWRRHPKELPASIIKRLPIRFTYDNNYFNDRYQGVPIGGYTKLFENLLDGIEVRCNRNLFHDMKYWESLAKKIVYTGRIDEYFGYVFGELEYLSLDFHHELFDTPNKQGVAQINYTGLDVPYTRTIEHCHMEPANRKHTVVTCEMPVPYHKDRVPYYPINDAKNMMIFNKYNDMAGYNKSVIFGGRLAAYRYYDMHQVIGMAQHDAKEELQKG